LFFFLSSPFLVLLSYVFLPFAQLDGIQPWAAIIKGRRFFLESSFRLELLCFFSAIFWDWPGPREPFVEWFNSLQDGLRFFR